MYSKPDIIVHEVDNTISIVMSSLEWKPGDGKPPWAGNPDKGRPKRFVESPFSDNPFGGGSLFN